MPCLKISSIDSVNKQNRTWVVANNFSLSMVVIKEVLSFLGKLDKFSEDFKFNLSEIHHVDKIDKPSGTAKSWSQWLNITQNCPIESIRKEDVKGEHKLLVSSNSETIELKHVAYNRSLFAKGAIWAADYILKNKLNGFYYFDDLVKGSIL